MRDVKYLASGDTLTLMERYLLILISVICSIIQCFNQNSISGFVRGSEGNAVDFVSVVASPANAPKTILASAFTDENGKFQMSVKSESDSLILKA